MKGKYIALGLIILLIGYNATGSIFREVELKNISTVSFDGNILYVGGSGPNNYTKIHDAINDSTDGDTIFVYNGTYYEHNITIDKSISLIGENRDDTIVYGTNSKSNALHGQDMHLFADAVPAFDKEAFAAINGDPVAGVDGVLVNDAAFFCLINLHGLTAHHAGLFQAQGDY